MTRTRERLYQAGIIFLAALIGLGILMGNQRPAQAQTVPTGSGIVCFVFTTVNDTFSIPLLSASDCAATTTPSGGGTLQVVKVVSGGVASPSDFDIHVKLGSSDVSGSPQPGSSSGVSYIGLTPTAYAVSEVSNTAGVNLSDYTVTYDGCPAGVAVVVAGQTPTVCRITNTFTPASSSTTGTITVKKVFGSGTTTPSLFSFTVNGGSTTAFNANGQNSLSLAPGTYTIAEVASSTYTASYSGCASVVVTAGSIATCTITNTLASGGGGGGGTTSDLSITKGVDNATPQAGGTVVYTLTVNNAGPANASGVTVTDLLPATLTYVSDDSSSSGTTYNFGTGAWTIGSLANGGQKILHITATIRSGTAGGTTITNSATVSNTNGDGNGNNNAAAKDVTVASPGGSPNNPPTVHHGGGGGGGGGGGCLNGFTWDFVAQKCVPKGIVLGAATSTATTSATCNTPLLSSFLRRGKANNSAEVKKLQQFLNTELQAKLPVTGFFGPLTDAAVKKFQTKYAGDVLDPWTPFGLINHTPTGYVYKTTQRKINLLHCAQLSIPMPHLP